MKPTKIQEEFVACINEHQRIFFKICNSYTKSREDKMDLYQEILFQVWRSYESFRKDSKISTWLYRIALNTSITWIRKDKKRSELSMSYDEVFGKEEEDGNIVKLYEAINLLSKTDRAFILLYLDDYSYKEISEIMGISLSNTGVKLGRIKEKLEKIITQSDELKLHNTYESR